MSEKWTEIAKLDDPFRVHFWRTNDEGKGLVACFDQPERATIIEIEMRKGPYTQSWQFPADGPSYEIDRLKAMLRWACEHGASQRSAQIHNAHRVLGVA